MTDKLHSAEKFVSVIILTFNGKNYIENCLLSILDQDYPENSYEIIVADNSSTDGTADWVENRFKNVKLIRFSRNFGFVKGNNLALEHARGEYIAFLNQDTVVGQSWLSSLVDALENNEEYAAFQSNQLMPWNKEFSTCGRSRMPEWIYFFDLTKFGFAEQKILRFSHRIVRTQFISGACFIIRKNVLGKSKVFCEKIDAYNEDMELSFRLIKNGHLIGTVPSSVVFHENDFNFNISKKNFLKNLKIIRNRTFVYHKYLSQKEFLRFLPMLIAAQSIKATTRLNSSKSNPIPLLLVFFGLFLFSLIVVGSQYLVLTSRSFSND